jgi:hypothetical protein
MPELKKAMSVYEKFGFTYLKGPWVIPVIAGVMYG